MTQGFVFIKSYLFR